MWNFNFVFAYGFLVPILNVPMTVWILFYMIKCHIYGGIHMSFYGVKTGWMREFPKIFVLRQNAAFVG